MVNADNIKGTVDVYNIYSISNRLLAKVYINSYSLKTSNKVPTGFYHRDEIPSTQDSKVLLKIMSDKEFTRNYQSYSIRESQGEIDYDYLNGIS